MRISPLLLIAVVAAPAAGREAVYQPKTGLLGDGYKDKLQKDGSWSVTAEGYAWPIDVAMYRAAELSRDAGHAFVELFDARGQTAYGRSSATLSARGSDASTPSAACIARKKRCYVADVAELLRLLSGPDGTQPGMAVVDHIDEYGREVRISGYGMAAAGSVARVVPAPRVIPAPKPVLSALPPTARQPVVFPARDEAAAVPRPVRGREPTQGWTISD